MPFLGSKIPMGHGQSIQMTRNFWSWPRRITAWSAWRPRFSPDFWRVSLSQWLVPSSTPSSCTLAGPSQGVESLGCDGCGSKLELGCTPASQGILLQRFGARKCEPLVRYPSRYSYSGSQVHLYLKKTFLYLNKNDQLIPILKSDKFVFLRSRLSMAEKVSKT